MDASAPDQTSSPDQSYTVDVLEERLGMSVGYGTLGHMVGLLVDDPSDRGLEKLTPEQIVQWAEANANELWDGVLGPALDEIARRCREAHEATRSQ